MLLPLFSCKKTYDYDKDEYSPLLALQYLMSPVIPSLISFNLLAPGFSSPVHVTNAGDGSGRLFVVEKGGVIKIIKNGTVLQAPFLDIGPKINTAGERGLLSMAFPPNAGTKTCFYVYYVNTAGNITVSRFPISSDPDLADPTKEEILLTVDHPPQNSNHNDGQVAFGGDGQLYIGTGDGGGSGDPLNNAQNASSNLGKMLRIDVEAGPGPYTPQIWASGLRNPFRFSFDTLTKDLYIADVGQGRYEEIDFQPASSAGGDNYGWRIMEGMHCFNPPNCSQTGLTLPVAEYDHSQGCAITGGHVYRGPANTLLDGKYLYGDFCSGKIWGLANTPNGWQSMILSDTTFAITSFGLDEDGNIYVADFNGGGIYLITAP